MTDLRQPAPTSDPARAAAGPACSSRASCCGAAPLRGWAMLAALLLTLPFVASQLLGEPATPTAASAAAGAAEEAPAAALDPAQLLPNGKLPFPDLLTGGAPAAADGYAALAAAGYRTYVDLRPESEAGAEAEAAARAAGMEYVRIPIAGAKDLDRDAARALDAILDAPGRPPVVLGCASGNRSGALLAVRGYWLEGLSPAAALELGRRGGMTRLEPAVRELLGLPAPAVE